MATNDNDGKKNKPKNPWGSAPNSEGNNVTPINSVQSDLPDLDDLLRKARDNFGFGGGGSGGDGSPKTIITGLLILAVLWLASGLYRVEPNENAVIQRFGELTRTQTQPGMGYHMPWPVETIKKINVTEDRRITIGFSDSLGRGVGKRDISEESLMLTADANIVNLDAVILWNIDSAEDFIFNIRNQEHTIKRVAESTIREVVGQTNLQPIITTGRAGVSTRARDLMQETLDSYGAGVSIKQVLIQDATVHPNVMEAFDDVVAAGQDAERFQNEANIYKNDILPKARGEAIRMGQQAEGYKQSRIARATGEAERFNKLYSAYKSGKDVTRERIYIETMEDVMSKSEMTIIDQENGAQGILPYLPLNRQNSK